MIKSIQRCREAYASSVNLVLLEKKKIFIQTYSANNPQKADLSLISQLPSTTRLTKKPTGTHINISTIHSKKKNCKRTATNIQWCWPQRSGPRSEMLVSVPQIMQHLPSLLNLCYQWRQKIINEKVTNYKFFRLTEPDH